MKMKRSVLGATMISSIIGVSAGMYAMSRMSSRQRRKVMKVGKRVMSSVMDRMSMF